MLFARRIGRRWRITGRVGLALLVLFLSGDCVQSADGFEPNDGFGEASDLGLVCGFALLLNAEVAPQGSDVDFYRFPDLTPGRTLVVGVFAQSGSSLDPLVAAFDSSYRRVAVNDNDPAAPGTTHSRLYAPVPSDGVLYVVVTASLDVGLDGGSDHLSQGAYSLTASCLIPSCGDGEILPPETCDPSGQPSGQPEECRSGCTYCGDGQINGGSGAEHCDDGNNMDGDGCRSDCTLQKCAQVVYAHLSHLPTVGWQPASRCLGVYTTEPSFDEIIDLLPDPPPGEGYFFRSGDRCAQPLAYSPCSVFCEGSSVSLPVSTLECDSALSVTIHECDEAVDPILLLSSSDVAARTTLEVRSASGTLLDVEAGSDFSFVQPAPTVSNFVLHNVQAVDSTSYDSGNGVLDARNGDRIIVRYRDESNGVADPGKERTAQLTVDCQPPLQQITTTGTSSGPAQQLNVPFLESPGLAGFYYNFHSSDHHLKEVLAYTGESTVQVRYEDSNQDDPYNWAITRQELPPESTSYTASGSATGSTDILLEQHAGVPVLEDFFFHFVSGDHHLDRIRVRLYRDLFRRLRLSVVFADQNGDDIYTWIVRYRMVPGSRVVADGVLSGGPITDDDQRALPATNPVIQGFDIAYTSNDHHMDELGVHLGSGLARVWYNDENDDDPFVWSVWWVDVE